MIKAVLKCDSYDTNKVISYLTKTSMGPFVEVIKCRNGFDNDYTKITIKVTQDGVLNEVLNHLNSNSKYPVLLVSKKRNSLNEVTKMEDAIRNKMIELVDKAKKEYLNDVTDHTETEYIVECLLNYGIILTQ